MIRSVAFDLLTKRERNQRFTTKGGAMAVAARQKLARRTAREVLERTFGKPPGLFYTPAGASPSYTDPNPITVRMWRVGPGWLDSDGPDDALKACRDGVADWLGIDDRNAGVEWPRGQQEKTPPGTPWRVRIEVSDSTPGPDRVVVLASTPQPVAFAGCTCSKSGRRKMCRWCAKEMARRDALKPDGDPGEELAARLLTTCVTCCARVGEPCRRLPTAAGQVLVHGVHPHRAAAAGINGVATPADRPKAPRTGVRKMAPTGQARLPLVRCYCRLPWEQATCGTCGGHGRLRQDPVWPVLALVGGHCTVCHGTGTTGMRLRIEDRADGLSPPPSFTYAVPDEHRERWGKTITLYRRSMPAGKLGTITVYDTKGR